MWRAISGNEVQITCILFFVSRSRRYFKLTLNAQNICVRKPSSERSFTFIVSECETPNRPTENSEIISHIRSVTDSILSMKTVILSVYLSR